MEREMEHRVMKKEVYFRIGTEYWRLIYVPDTIISTGCFQLVKWNVSTLKHDHGKEILKTIRKFDSSVTFDSTPRLDHIFYYVDFKKGKDYLPNRKTPQTVYYLIDEKKFFEYVGLDRESIFK